MLKRSLFLGVALPLILLGAQFEVTFGAPIEDALKSLRLAMDKGYSAQEAWNDPELQKLQALPQFSQLVKEFTPKSAKP